MRACRAALYLISVLGLGMALSQPAAAAVTAADYARAESFLPHNLAGKLRNAGVTPHWVGSGDRFWYRRDRDGGHEFVLVTSADGRRQPAFDHAAIARSLSALEGKAYRAEVLPFDRFDYADAGRTTIRFALGDATVTCIIGDRCSKQAIEKKPGNWSVSPDGRSAVYLQDHNLWLAASGGRPARQLTSDGEAHFAYGAGGEINYRAIATQTAAEPPVPDEVWWSPAGDRLFARRLDKRAIADYPMIESAPRDGTPRPKVYNIRASLPGDRALPRAHYSLINTGTGAKREIALPVDNFDIARVEWHPNGRSFYVMGTEQARSALLFAVDATTGEVRRLIEDRDDKGAALNNSYYNAPNVRLLFETGDIVWFSQRSGWGHLYRYDLATGRLKNGITGGDWLVRDIVNVDEASRRLFFTAGGREGGNPYHRRLYSVGLDGRGLRLITPEAADHEFTQTGSPQTARLRPSLGTNSLSPDFRYVVDVYSRVDQPPVSVLRRADGRVIATLERADDTALRAAGWTPPQPFTAKAADGTTDLYGLLYLPSNFDPNRRYKVIEHIYAGPQIAITPHNYATAFQSLRYMKPLAELGFAVVILDARGTPQRSKAFQDFAFPSLESIGVDDRVGAIRQLAARHRFLDIDKGVGIIGHSFGGYAAARALLLRPDFYTVGAASAGSHRFQASYRLGLYFVGDALYKDGSPFRTEPDEVAERFRLMDNGELADRLTGKLLLAYGDLDENAYPAMTLQLADRLIAADKNFDLVYLPNRDHNFFRTDPYYIRRTWDYFVEHLAGERPPTYRIRDFQLAP